VLIFEYFKQVELAGGIYEDLGNTTRAVLETECNYLYNALSFFFFIFALLDPKICTLTPNGHLELTTLTPVMTPRGSYPTDRLTYALGSRKSSVMSLGKANLEQRRSFSLVRCNTHTHTQPLTQNFSV
jgi:hypothetical protein